jgi:hypothetical protein
MSERTPSVPANQVQPATVTTELLPPRKVRCRIRQAKTIYLESSFGLVRVTRKEALSVLPRSRKVCTALRISSMFNGESVAVSAV